MRKLKMDLDELVVDSFATGEAGSVGTVRGFDTSGVCATEGEPSNCNCASIVTCPNLIVTCNQTCDVFAYTCNGLETCADPSVPNDCGHQYSVGGHMSCHWTCDWGGFGTQCTGACTNNPAVAGCQ